MVTALTRQRSKAMTRFDECIASIMEIEGGWADDPHDKGGKTNKGITIATFVKWRYKGKDDPTPETIRKLIRELRGLTDDEAKLIYHTLYWTPSRCEQLPKGIDFCVLDTSINSGVHKSIEILQGQLGVVVDGLIGKKTLAAANAYPDQRSLIHKFMDARIAYLRTRSTFWKHGTGWLDRCARVRREAIGVVDVSHTKR
jgi:lysozyme family protein